MIRSAARGLFQLRSSAPPPPRQYTEEEKLKLRKTYKKTKRRKH